jgi:hypothetical protein
MEDTDALEEQNRALFSYFDNQEQGRSAPPSQPLDVGPGCDSSFLALVIFVGIAAALIFLLVTGQFTFPL